MGRKRTMVAAVVVGATMGLVGCGQGTDGEQEGDGMMRERTIEAFEDKDPDLATFAGDKGTRPEPIDAPFVDDWYIFQLSGQHRVTVVAVTKDGEPRGVELSGSPQAWDEVVEGVSVTDAQTAGEVGDAWVRALRPTVGAARIIDSVDDIKLTGSRAEETREELRRDHGDAIGDREVTVSGDDWTLARWMVHDNDLVRLDLIVHPDATVDSRRTVVQQDLPGPIAL